MRLADLARTAVSSLWQQKARTILTLTGVLVGTCSLAFSLSLGVGLRAMIDREFQKRSEFWWVRVFAGARGTAVESDDDIPPEAIAVDSKVTGERAARLREALIEQYRRGTPPKNVQFITPAIMDTIRALPHVDEIRLTQHGYGRLTVGDRFGDGPVIATRLDQLDPPLESRIIHGRLPAAAGECVVSEFGLYRIGIRDESLVAGIVGQTVTYTMGAMEVSKGVSLANLLGPKNPLESVTLSQAGLFDKLLKQLPDKLDSFDLSTTDKLAIRTVMTRRNDATPEKLKMASGTYTVVGIVRPIRKSEFSEKLISNQNRDVNSTDIYISPDDGQRLFGQLQDSVSRGVTDIQVHCRPTGDLRETVEAIKALNLQTASTLEWYESSKLEVTLISVGLNVFSLVALFIAAIGITNTLVTSVLERTREIGIFKALGANDRDVIRLFLGEGALIGLVGGTIGVVLARIIASPADDLVKNLVQKVSRNRLITESIFEFPPWLWGGALLFAVLITTLAAWYPARRAARVEPVEALRHE